MKSEYARDIEREVAAMTRGELGRVRSELTRAVQKFGWQHNLTPTQDLSVITEELGEVARELNDATNENRPTDADKIRAELRQVAAMVLKMLVKGMKGGE